MRKKTKHFAKRNGDTSIKARYNKLSSLIREEIDALKNNEWKEFIKNWEKIRQAQNRFGIG